MDGMRNKFFASTGFPRQKNSRWSRRDQPREPIDLGHGSAAANHPVNRASSGVGGGGHSAQISAGESEMGRE